MQKLTVFLMLSFSASDTGSDSRMWVPNGKEQEYIKNLER